MKFLTTNIWIFMFLCVIPILQVYLHCIYYGSYPKSIPIAVYNQETDCVYNQCENIEECSYLSCHFLYVLNQNHVRLDYYSSESLATDSMAKGSTLGLIKVSKNYTRAMINSIKKIASKERNELLKSNIVIEIDMSKYGFGNYLKQNIMEAHRLHLMGVYSQYNLSTKYAKIPYMMSEYKNLNLTENTICQIITCSVFSSAMSYFALLLQSEIQNGYLTRNVIAGVTIFEILLSFFTVQIIFSIVQAFSLFFLADFLLNISWESSLLLIVQINIVIGICGMSIGLLIGSCARSSTKAFYGTLFVYFVNLMFAGVFWPIENTLIYLLPFTIFLPLPIPNQVIKSILIEGMQFKKHHTEMEISIIITSFWTFVSLIIFTLKLKNKINFIF